MRTILLLSFILTFQRISLAEGRFYEEGNDDLETKDTSLPNDDEDAKSSNITDETSNLRTNVKQTYGEDVEEDQKTDNCYELHRPSIPIISREFWKGGRQDIIGTSVAVKFVAIRDGGRSCSTRDECLSHVQSEKMATQKKECALRENFYIGGNGTVLEGRGWDIAPYWYLNGLRTVSVNVKILGSYEDEIPPRASVEALEELVAGGLRLGKLSLDYKVTTMRQVLQNDNYAGGSLQKYAESGERWADESVFASTWEYSKPIALKFVSRKQWGGLTSSKKLPQTQKVVEYVLISNGGNRCENRDECVARVKQEEVEGEKHHDDLLENFYIGDGGWVYEGRGWGVSPHWYVKGIRNNYISVRLWGDFRSDLPPESALHAFKSLVNAGITLGKISPEFKLVSLRKIYDDSALLGDALVSYVEKWKPWSSTINSFSTSELQSFGALPLVSRSEWSDKPLQREECECIKSSIRYVIVRESGNPCFTNKGCTDAMRLEEESYAMKYGDVPDNFYIGSDGVAYEGRGWSSLPHFRSKYFNSSYVTINIFGSYGESEPSKTSILAFNSLLKIGISLNRLSPNYQLYSLRRIYEDPRFLGEELAKVIESSDHWHEDPTKMDEKQRAASGLLPIVSREGWKAREFNKTFMRQNLPAEWVIVGETGSRCFKHDECLAEIQREQNNTVSLYGHMPDNFYVGDDGNAFEGTGWEVDPFSEPGNTENAAVFVTFFGDFEESLPDEMALAAFRRLLRHGVETSRLSPGYRIVTVRQVSNDTVGRRLHEAVESWSRWSSVTNEAFRELRSVSKRLVLVSRSRWGGVERYAQGTDFSTPQAAEYLTIVDGGEPCYTPQDCTSRIRLLRDMPMFGKDLENFFVGEDGRVYEGLGWDSRPFPRSDCTADGCNFVVVRFIGGFRAALPRETAIRAFKSLVTWGVEEGKMSPRYGVFSLDQLCSGRPRFLGESLDYSIRSWDHRWQKMNASFDCGLLSNRIIPTEEWGSFSLDQSGGWLRIGGPKRFIHIHSRGDRCRTVHQCTAAMKAIREDAKRSGDHIAENFYVGDDGNVYEGRGWHRRPRHEFESFGSSINVLFLGAFQDEPPSQHAVEAFRNILLKRGLEIGSVSEDFEVRHVPDGSYATPTGRKLKEAINILSNI